MAQVLNNSIFSGFYPAVADINIYRIDVITGKLEWYSPSPALAGADSWLAVNSAPPVVLPGLLFAGSPDGHIRAYHSGTGYIAWDYNTIQKYKTVNGLPGQGGSIDSAARVVSHGMLFVNWGYGLFGEKPGNVLLAFGVAK